jgi:hypothetical protein
LIEDNTVTLPARQLRKHSLATLDRGPPRVVAIGLGLNPFQQVLILGGTATPDTRRTTTNLNLSTRWRRARRLAESSLCRTVVACHFLAGHLEVPAKRKLRPGFGHLPEGVARGLILGFVSPAPTFARKPPTIIV